MTKLLTIIYDAAIDASLLELLDALQVTGYTRLTGALGRGGRGEKRDTAVFPGSNNVILLVLPADGVGRVARAVRRLQHSYRLKPGVTLLSQDVEELP